MKKLSIEQMEVLNGGVDVCRVARVTTAGAGMGMALGLKLAGPIGIATFIAVATTAIICEYV